MNKQETLRERFEDNYIPVRIPDGSAKGYKIKYVYYAPWYRWDLSAEQFRREKYRICICSILSFLVFVFAATQKTEPNAAGIVLIFCALTLCAFILEFAGLVQFCLAKQPTTKMTYQDVDRMMAFAPAARTLFAGLSGCVSLFKGAGSSVQSLAVAAGYWTCAVLAGYEVYRYNRIPVQIQKNTIRDEMTFLQERRTDKT